MNATTAPSASTDAAVPRDPPGFAGSSGSSLPKKPRPRRTMTYVAIAAVLVIVVSGISYEVITSGGSSNPCGSFTAQQLGANATAGTISGNTTPNFANATTATNGPLHQVPVGQVIQVVAAENFWGSLVSQMGGNLTHVLSIISDPNTDPHEYEANTSDSAAISQANLVIVNGVGYDDWAIQEISSSNTPGQEVLNVGTLNGVYVTGGIVSGNPHQWYNPLYVNHTLLAMYADLVALQPASKAIFQQNFNNLNTSTGGGAGGVSIDQLYSRADQIREEFKGTVVASTESIFVYLANYTGLALVSPQPFMEAIAEGNDPPAQSVALFQCQLESSNVKVLVYNVQTVTPITTTMKSIAASHNVTITFVSETIQPPDTSFQDWMYGEYNQLENALDAYQLGQ
jgi:zinc/manganese transport system substrate-binding protein